MNFQTVKDSHKNFVIIQELNNNAKMMKFEESEIINDVTTDWECIYRIDTIKMLPRWPLAITTRM